MVVWDKSSADYVSFNGLGGTSLVSGVDDRFDIRISNFDFANQKSAAISVRVYEYNLENPRSVYAEAIFELKKSYNKTFSIPFPILKFTTNSLDFIKNAGALVLTSIAALEIIS